MSGRPALLVLAFFFWFVPRAAGAEDPGARWNALVDRYLLEAHFRFDPAAGTAAGLHEHDGKLVNLSRAEIAKHILALKLFLNRVTAFRPAGLDAADSADRQMLLGAIRSQLLTLEVIRPWEKDPDSYSGAAANSVYVIMSRRFAPPVDRLRSVIAREKRMPELFAAARANLKNPPRIHTEIALEQLPGIIAFFEKDVPAAFADATDPAVAAEFRTVNARVIAGLRNYQSWLTTELLPHSTGDFRIGAQVFRKKLRYDEMVDTPLDRLLEIATADLKKNQAEFARVAREVDARKSPAEVLAMLGSRHPAPGELLQTFRNTFDGLVAFIKAKHILTLPAESRPTLQETPPFERATTTASMDTPGPFENVATESYFNVTLPAPDDSPEAVASLMSAYNVGTIVSTSVHEAFPGHFVQFLYAPSAPTKLRKLMGANTNGEGWAHYTEQMMLDEGFGQPGTGARDETEARLIRLGQLQDALLRDARFVVGIQLHRGGMTLDEAREFFAREGYQTRKIAEIETKRGTSDPTYLYYTLGKLEILKLREDYRKKEGAAFSLERFHNEFLKQGYPPIPIVRRAMLGEGSPVL